MYDVVVIVCEIWLNLYVVKGVIDGMELIVDGVEEEFNGVLLKGFGERDGLY